MRTLAFDGATGAAGDMILGALLAAGADRGVLATVEETDALDLEYRVRTVARQGITATRVDVVPVGDEVPAGEDDHDHAGEDAHDHPAEGHGPHRSYEEVVGLVEDLDLPGGVREDALATFELLGEAEAAVHGTDLADTHFHEVGADDAVADVVGAALLVDDLGVERVVTTPPAAGGGTVSTSHGEYPVPPPAVVAIAERADWSLRGGPVDRELLTPTGAAVLAHHADGVEHLPPLDVADSGYGAGTAELANRPNVLRATVGEAAGGLAREPVRLLETNLDDASPEVLGGLQETLADAGARDVTVLPTTTKKARPGHLVKVVVDAADAERVAARLARETGTLGVRDAGVTHRWVADREVVTATLLVDGERHAVPVKIGRTADGAAFDVSAEFDDALAVARETGLAVRAVMRRAETAASDGGALDDRLVHVVAADRWAAVEGAYRPASLEEAGYVHLSPVDRVLGVAASNHPADEDPQLVVVDPDAVDAELRYEETPSGAFPHLYGPLEVRAVVDVLDLPREDGRFVLPPELA